MIIFQEIVLTKVNDITISDEFKKDFFGKYYGYAWAKIDGEDVPFSFDTKTGQLNLSGHPWNWIAKELRRKPYTVVQKNFLSGNADKIAKQIKTAR